ncbi:MULTISPECIES: glutamine synthetase family protein [unclassified Chelatococcus]|uniref:glutamine synthetase family protein n=1 Tax=unclassified Chelatococcus TaxID=2638111 RepID=UPI001BCBCF75|nr:MULTISPECIES: glutamine synthetase family protein [unclassified Chelatococcus]MBS7699127.1 glutamine synthetase [Chelatococcus sp. YT9]MBX3554908.1 glutamine synthetase [Chelatococcus sp.]
MAKQDKKGTKLLQNNRGAADIEAARAFVDAHGIEDIECFVPNQAGVARGKMMPSEKFFGSPNLSLPGAIFYQTISGDYPDEVVDKELPTDGDLILEPDLSTLTVVPWASDPTAQIIHDAYFRDGRPVETSPRQVLKRVVDMYRQRGWQPIVAPEIEFYLVKRNTDPDYPLEPPIGRSGRAEIGRQAYSIAAVNEFDALFDLIYDYSEAQGLEIDTLIHEEGAGQMEINLRHGDPIDLADQVFLFKRTIREAALAHDMYATFMAKPIAHQPGSAMHIHMSVVDAETGANIFTNQADGQPTQEFFSYIAGLQTHLPAAMAMLAPYVNSYRRLTRHSTAPINTRWGYDNRTTGLRVPPSSPEARRVENRVPSSDANPYLAIAASLACGLLGVERRLRPGEPVPGSAYDLDHDLPLGLLEAVAALEESEAMREILGESFVRAFTAVKRSEFETFMEVISPWEREYLLLNV